MNGGTVITTHPPKYVPDPGVRPLPDTGPQRFTAEAEPVEVSIWEGSKLLGSIDVGTAADRDAFVAQVNGTRTDDLPAGVHRIDGRLWLLPEHPLPDGWEWATAMNKTTQWSSDRDSFVNLKRVRMFEVRPVQQPDTEIIDTRLAKGRTLPDGRQIVVTGDDDLGPWFIIAPVGDRNHAAEVTVLKDGGRS